VSAEAVTLLQGLYAQFARGDFGALAALTDEFELITAPEMPDAGTYRGAAARRWLETWVDSFDNLTFEADEFIDAGDRVLVGFRQKGTPRGGNATVELPTWAVYTMGESLGVMRNQLFMNRDPAAAAGLAG
jgi:ketosteroid isomerase-like protein